MNEKNVLAIGLGTIGILSIDILLVLFDVLPDWWYVGWLWQPWSVATGKMVVLATAGVFIVIITAALIWSRKEV